MMNEWWLLLIFFIFFSMAMLIIGWPLKKNKVLLFFIMPVCCILVMSAYWQWGAFGDWRTYLRQQDKQRQVEALLKRSNGPYELIEKLKEKLNEHPDSAHGWFLLGRLYASQNDWENAKNAFSSAYRLTPQDEQIIVNYAQSLWQLNQQVFNESIRSLLQNVLQRNPLQPDSLAMLAMDAYMSHDYQSAIHYWQRLLEIAPQGSEDADAIRKALAKAHDKLQSQVQKPTPLK